jgi:hypothetical protein
MADRENLWLEIESLDCFAFPPNSETGRKECDKAWKWLETIQKDNKIRSVDLIRLKSVIESVYSLGYEAGKEFLIKGDVTYE